MRAFGSRVRGVGPLILVGLLAVPVAVAGTGPSTPLGQAEALETQEPAADVMVVAGRWALDRLPDGAVRLDPHRSGEGKERAVVERVAGALGAELGTLEETRLCEDAMDPATCRLESTVLLAIAPPRIDGEKARVKVYAWYASGSVRSPVAQESWELELRRSGEAWRVVSGS